MTDGICGVNDSRVYTKQGVLHRCLYRFGHEGRHSWEITPRRTAWTQQSAFKHDREDGKLSREEAEFLEDDES